MSDDWQRYLLIVLLVLIVIIFIIVMIRNKIKSDRKMSVSNQILDALGGVDNIESIERNGLKKIDVVLANKKSMDKRRVRENGVNAIVVKDKKITLITYKHAEEIYDYIKSELK